MARGLRAGTRSRARSARVSDGGLGVAQVGILEEHESRKQAEKRIGSGREAAEGSGHSPAVVQAAEGHLDESTSGLSDHVHIGAYLAAQRRLRGISRDDLCRATHIPIRSLERLEDGLFDEIDDGFVRGFVRTVSDALGLDLNDTQARMSVEPDPSESGSGVVLSLARAGVMLAALTVVLGSVGLVSMAMRFGPEPRESEIVMRRDPVRALAEVHGAFEIPALAPILPPELAPAEPPGEVVAESSAGPPIGEGAASPTVEIARDSREAAESPRPAPTDP